ncbi:universal stress protein [Cellulomonas sp. zg-ZUI199]|uniref:Universal stress protein n=1 Tax=Cellulomonas wangleii TaxID=2816956 RepID=A0ABX8D489_9CELL|nr:universal stress protein [Cellulomonas wangleii]MBO0926598.1 universal stress protein [Cellulomonas wangleii]QVI60842.1 universal stress protein [Cellulomonas wangleii]
MRSRPLEQEAVMVADGPVVIALDGGPHSAHTLRWGLQEAERRGADVLLVHAWQEPYEVSPLGWYAPFIPLGLDRDAQAYLDAQRERATAAHPGLRVDTRAVQGAAVPAILAAAEGAQLLVIGASGRADGSRLSSVAGHVAAHAPVPVAVVRQAAADGPAGPVVVGVDGSATSLAAARTAARAASSREVPLVLVHARPTVEDPYGTHDAPVPLPPDEAGAAHHAASRLAQDLREEHPGLQVDVEVVEDSPAHALAARSVGSDLVVVGCRGLGAFRGMLLGSVSHDVLRTAASSVLVGRAEA